ncbi:long-chain fatty alcohol dehydrogenase [Violaceomyces palustris]|uniref:Long-chain fatty alcohol dehydrogenase n=1 Tax=Violaceomyces palustris TaxID=1673888 RepID=A0ACD0NRB0_9BASI|nr:long-chain fatty alcohol dehydrogenase [Violaceomyces palustris]
MPPPPMPNQFKASDLWTPVQQEVFLAFADAVIPTLEGEQAARVISSLPPNATPRQKELVAQFASQGFASDPKILDRAAQQIKASLSTSALNQVGQLLTILGTRPGCLALTGHIGPFQNLARQEREKVIKSWMASSLALLQKAASGLKGIALIAYYRHHQPAWEAIGYPDGVADDWKRDNQGNELALETQVEHYPYVFENEKLAGLAQDANVTLDTEVLVIGSGAGGGVAGSYLAQRGVRVLIVDKGIYLRPSEVLGREDQGYSVMYEGEGILASEDGTMNVLAGSTFGGGTTVNWSASLKPRHFLREAWATKYGIPYFKSPLFTSDLNAVATRMGVSSSPIRHNLGNSLLALGAQRAGQPVEAVPQNTGGHTHYCGKCHLGCVSGHKQGGTITWLKDAAEAGASFMTSCEVHRILFDKDRKAIGALATVDGRRVTIRASKGVVVSGGSIQTPALLLRCPELKYNKMIGKNLRLHPATAVTGYYNFPINPWEGGLLTMVSNAAEMFNAEGWGAKIEVIASSPAIHAAYNSFDDAVSHKARMLRYSHSFTMVVICRDRDAGRVFVDDEGKARMEYVISKFDQRSLLHGILKATDCHMMAGACEIATPQVGVAPYNAELDSNSSSTTTTRTNPTDTVFVETTAIPGTFTPADTVPRDLNSPGYKKWQQEVIKAGARPFWLTIGSAHQMGSCRMGSTPKIGALDPEGRVWGTKNLWVADASTLPESSGVNPMITTMATSRGIARNVAKELGVETTRIGTASLQEARL